jgi:two-component system sensor histidine kinase KdpD
MRVSRPPPNSTRWASPAAYAAAIVLVATAAAVGWPIHSQEHLSDVAMLFVLAIVIAAIRFGRGPALMASVLAVLVFDFFFVPPELTFAVSQLRHVITFVVMIVVGVVISAVAERARREAERARAAELEQASERVRAALLSSVSHDLRTPLSVITGAATALMDGRAPSDELARRELLATIRDEADRLAKLVTDMLDMSRVESGALKLRREWHSMEELIGSAIAAVERRLGERELSVDAPGDLPLASIDGALVQQVLVNLLDNAIQHTPASSPIEVRARADGEAIRIEVLDRGPGVQAVDAERIFEKFRQQAPRGRQSDGFGLGLAIARGLAEAHGGDLVYRSREGGGASFELRLPTGGLPPPEPEAQPVEEPA